MPEAAALVRPTAAFVKAMHAACVRAAELGDEFGRTPPH